MKRINALQAQHINQLFPKEFWDELGRCGHVIGGGVHQLEDGELVFCVFYERGSVTRTVPLAYNGFRIVPEERAIATM